MERECVIGHWDLHIRLVVTYTVPSAETKQNQQPCAVAVKRTGFANMNMDRWHEVRTMIDGIIPVDLDEIGLSN
jgi:hypothetical protein